MKNTLAYTTMYHNRHLLFLTIVIIVVGGLSALLNLPRLEDPRIDTRNASVTTFYPGASSARVESLVTKPIEDKLRELSEIKFLESTSRDGVSAVIFELQDWVDNETNEQIFSKIRDLIDEVKLPAGVSKPNFDDKRGAAAFTSIIALSIQKDDLENIGILNRLAKELQDRLREVPSTDIVRIYGEVKEQVIVEVSQDKLILLGLDNIAIANIIKNSDSKNPAGVIRNDKENIFIEVDGELDSIKRISNIPVISNENGGTLFLGDIASIKKSYQNPPDEMAFSDFDKRSIYVGARMNDDIRIDKWTTHANRIIDQFTQEYSDTIEIEKIFEQERYTNERLSDLSKNLILGMLVVMLVVLVFMGWKPSLIVGLSLPLAMAAALFSLSFFDEKIHQMSIFGLIISIGLLIDNAIVITHEVRKNMFQRGMDNIKALSEAVDHLKVPLFASTLTTILGFMPIFLLPGNVGNFVGPIAISVVLSLIFSFALALSVIATITSIYTKKGEEDQKRWFFSGIDTPRINGIYEKILNHALKNPIKAISISLVLPILGIALSTTLPNVFFPSADRDHFEIQVWLNENSSIKNTEKLSRQIDKLILEQKEVVDTHWMVAASTPSLYYNQIMTRDNFPIYSQAVIFTNSPEESNLLIPKLQDMLDEKFPEALIIVRAFAQGPPVSSPVAFRIVGPDASKLRVLGERVRLELENHLGVTHSFASIEGAKQKLYVRIDEAKAQIAGLSLSQIATTLQTKLEGVSTTTLLEDLQELEILIRDPKYIQNDIQKLSSINIYSQKLNQYIPISSLGEFELIPELTSITRRNGERINQIEAFLHPDVAPIDVSKEIMKSLDESDFNLPTGYRLEVAGDADAQNEALGLLLTYLPVLILLMVATLILSFKSVALAGLIGMVALLSAGLGFLSLAISGYPIGFNPLIGIAGLVGVAINGSIVVLAAIRANEKARAGDQKEIIKESMLTARHILSTSFTTVAGFMPLLLSGGTFWPPLAVVIAGGVGFSVILSLYFTPSTYMLLKKYIKTL